MSRRAARAWGRCLQLERSVAWCAQRRRGARGAASLAQLPWAGRACRSICSRRVCGALGRMRFARAARVAAECTTARQCACSAAGPARGEGGDAERARSVPASAAPRFTAVRTRCGAANPRSVPGFQRRTTTVSQRCMLTAACASILCAVGRVDFQDALSVSQLDAADRQVVLSDATQALPLLLPNAEHAALPRGVWVLNRTRAAV
jgi:hypothetical protein